jgi:hypothetical protein
VAFETEEFDDVSRQQFRIGRTVRRVADLTAFDFDRRVLVNERPLFVGSAQDSLPTYWVGSACGAGLDCAASLPDFSFGALPWASVEVNAATRVDIVGVSDARQKTVTSTIFRVRMSCSLSTSVMANSSGSGSDSDCVG